MLLRTACRAAAIPAASLLMLIPASSAAAHSSQGATVERIDRCFDFPPVTLCQTGRILTHMTVTPSGRYHLTQHADIDSIIDSPYCDTVESLKYRDHAHYILETGISQVFRVTNHIESRATCPGVPPIRCESTYAYHVSNDQVRYDRSEWACVEEPV